MSSKYLMKVRDGTDLRAVGVLVKLLIDPSTVGSKQLVVAICFINPGEEVLNHRHHYEEGYFILQGEGVMRVGDSGEFGVTKYDSVYVPSNVAHWTKNTGNEPLVMLCSVTPPIGEGEDALVML